MDYRVISADDHIDLRWMPQDLWSSRLPAHLRERGPRVQDTERGPCSYIGLGQFGMSVPSVSSRRRT